MISFTVTTSSYKYVDYNVNETTYVVFKAKGNDAGKAGLFTETLTDLTGVTIYEFLLGSYFGTKVGLRKRHVSPAHSVYTSPTLATKSYNDQEFTTFWMSWKDHNMSLGHGNEVGKKTFFSYHDTISPIEINHLGFASKSDTANTFSYYNGKTFQNFI